MSDGIPRLRSPSSAIGEANRLAGQNRTAEAERFADRRRQEALIARQSQANEQAALGAIGDITRFVGGEFTRLFELDSARKRNAAQTQMELRVAEIGRGLADSNEPTDYLNESIGSLNNLQNEQLDAIPHAGQRDELQYFTDLMKARELPVLEQLAEQRVGELYVRDFTNDVHTLEMAGDWSGVLDRFERGYDDGMLDRAEMQGEMERVARSASMVGAGNQARVIAKAEGYDEATTWINSQDAKDLFPYMERQDWAGLREDVNSQRRVDDAVMDQQISDQIGQLHLWAMSEGDGGRFHSGPEIRAKVNEIGTDMTLQQKANLEADLRRMLAPPDAEEGEDRDDTERGREILQALDTAGDSLTLEKAPTYYDRFTNAHKQGWINDAEYRRQLSKYNKFYGENLSTPVARAAKIAVDDFLKLTMLADHRASGVTKDEMGNWQVPKAPIVNWVRGVLGLDPKSKDAPLQKKIEDAEGNFVSLTDTEYNDYLMSQPMPLIRQDGSVGSITLHEMMAYTIRNTEETLGMQAKEGQAVYNPREAFEALWYQMLAGYMPGLQTGEWKEIPQGYALTGEGLGPELRPAELEPGASGGPQPAFRGAQVPDPGTERGLLGRERAAEQRHPIARAQQFIGGAPPEPRRITAQPLERTQGIGAMEALGIDPGELAEVQRLIDAGHYDAAQEYAATWMPQDPDGLDELQQAGTIYDYSIEYQPDGGRRFLVRFNASSIPYPIE